MSLFCVLLCTFSPVYWTSVTMQVCALCKKDFVKLGGGKRYNRTSLSVLLSPSTSRKLYNIGGSEYTNSYICDVCEKHLSDITVAKKKGGRKRRLPVPPASRIGEAKKPRKTTLTQQIIENTISYLKDYRYDLAIRGLCKGIQAARNATVDACRQILQGEKKKLTKMDGWFSQDVTEDSLHNFPWEKAVEEARRCAPATISCLTAMLPEAKTIRTQKMMGRTRDRRKLTMEEAENHLVIRKGVLVSIILFTAKPKKCKFLPASIGIQMYRLGCPQKMFQCLNDVGISQGIAAARRHINRLKAEQDEPTDAWKETTEEEIMWNQRPKPGDTEEDLLKFQEEFLRKGASSAASVARKPGHKRTSASGSEEGKGEACTVSSTHRDVVHLQGLPNKPPVVSPAPPLKKSRFKASRESHRPVLTDDPEKDLESHDRSTAAILTDIIERDTRNAGVYFPQSSTRGFPTALHRGSTPQSQGSTKSLFAQQMGLSPLSQLGVSLHAGQQVNSAGGSVLSKAALDGGSPTSNILRGTSKPGFVSAKEVEVIHNENQAKLSSMSEDEILLEQRKLLDSLDPKLVMFLRGKKAAVEEETMVYSGQVDSETVAIDSQESDNPVEQERPSIPIPLNQNWLHMDVVESDKLAWMSELPVPKADNLKTGQTARFDFSGSVLATDCDLPVTLGLHHHGEEPERAGYTLEELFALSRSSNIQQRSLALQTLARILTKAKAGELSEGVQTAVVPVVVDAGIVFLARWAMDDSVDTVLIAGLSLMKAILLNTADEAALDDVFSWPGGVSVVSQCPDQSVEDIQDTESKSEESDAEILKNDLILGMVSRMSILPRLYNFLSSWRPQAHSVLNILAILTRITRHSQQTAYQVLIFPGLIETVVVEFLPTSWKSTDITQPKSCVYDHPVPEAVRFLRTIAQAGRNMAAILVSKYEVLSRSMVYVAMDTSDLPLPLKEAVSLQTEVYRLWTVCLLYGLTTQLFIDLYPTLIQRLQHVDVSRCLTDHSHLISAFVGVFRAVVIAASANKPVVQRYDQNNTEQLSKPLTPCLPWSSVKELITPIRALWDRLSLQTILSYQHQKQSLEVTGAVSDFMAEFYHHRAKQADVNPVPMLEELESLSEVLITHWKSVGFQAILSSLSSYSNLLSASDNHCTETTPSLPELTVVSVVGGHRMPILCPHSPIAFVTAFLKLALSVCKAQKGLIQSVVSVILDDSYLRSYLKRVTSLSRPSSLQTNYFTRFENYILFYLVKLIELLQQVDGPDIGVYHSGALCLLIRLHHGDEHLAHDLLSTVIFNSSFIREGISHELARAGLEEMDIANDGTGHLHSATQCEVSAPRTRLLSDIVKSLPSIRATYLSAFTDMSKEVQISRARHLGQVKDTQTFFTSHIGECLMPADWMFIPLVDLYNRSLKHGDEVCSSPDLVSRVSDCLGWLYLLECWRGETLTPVTPSLRLTRVMCVFLAGNDLFLDGRVQALLSALLREYTRPHSLRRMDFEAEIPGLTSFYDLYMSLLQQYLAVSFGDSLFGCYILLPLQQQHNVGLRKSVWGEHSRILRTLTIPIQEMLIPLGHYLSPEESDPEMIGLYIQSLLSRTARPEWCPVLYLIAVHHVNRFMYSQDGACTLLKHTIIRQISITQHLELKRHLLFYKSPRPDLPYGMELYEELPLVRRQLLADLETGGNEHPNT